MIRFALALALALIGCGRGRGATPVPAPPPSVAHAPRPTCAGTACAPGQFCETRFKGHDADLDGRPLDQTRCEPLPEACQAQPTCACVAAVVSMTSCEDDHGLLRTDDTP